jgi:exodeoxyribonuclease V beta subunit
MLYFLMAVSDISGSNINRALLSPFTGFGKTEILALDIQHTTQLFRKYKTLWETDGVFTTIKTFMADYQTVKKLNQQNAQQTLTNLHQLTELLHKTQTSKKISDLDLISWLNRGINGQTNDGDEYQQRIESDEEAVKIATIHASKGLEYNIVFAPYLDFTPKTNHKFCTFREPNTSQYVTIAKADLNEEQAKIIEQQEAQENSRLIYVAITRAIYKCYIYRNTYYRKSALTHFTSLVNNENTELIYQTSDYPTDITPYLQLPTYAQTLPTPPPPVNFQLLQKHWHKLSYSFLKAPYQYYPTIKTNQKLSAYDNFIFNELAKGAQTGNMLHYIYENIQLEAPATWQRVVTNAIKNFAVKETETFSKNLVELLKHTLNTTINIDGESFILSDVSSQNCINELEFDFTVSPFNIPQLKTLEDEDTEISLNSGSNLEGVMNGKIDLFFEHNGKYYVLDWKSNYLGDSLENYLPVVLNHAMNQSNYHLQYLIYTLAVKKYLENRVLNFNYETQFGGVIYLFLRGMRVGLDTGIYINKPSLQKIDFLGNILGG